MPLSLDDRVELEGLADAVVDETITSEQRSRLRRLLKEQAEARVHFVLAMGMHASLHTYAGEGRQATPRKRVTPPRWRSRRTLAIAGSVAAVLLVAVWFALPGGGEVRARLAGVQAPEWEDAQSAPEVGDVLRDGRRIALTAGTVELEYDNGARVTLSGPGVFVVGEVEPPSEPNEEIGLVTHGHLDRGTIAVYCPPGAEGFAVAGPDVRVVDLGTRYTLHVDRMGRSETHVTLGRVRLLRMDGQRRVAARRTLSQREVGRIRGGKLTVGTLADDPTQPPTPGAIDVVLGETIDRHWEDVKAEGFAYGPKQIANGETGETTIWLPYGHRPGVFGEVVGQLTDPAHVPATFSSRDRTADSRLVFHLKFDAPIESFVYRDGRSEWELGEHTVGGVEYSVDGVVWTPIRTLDGPHQGRLPIQPFVNDFTANGLDTRELRIRYFARAAEGAPGPPGERFTRLYLTGGPAWADADRSFFKNQFQLRVRAKR